MNRRLAAHNSRKGSIAVQPGAPAETQHSASSRAAQAAARVAARFASAPSYSEVLAEEARAAVRAAEAASRAALEAQAAAESVLAGLEAASDAEPEWEQPVKPAAPAVLQIQEKQPYAIRWEPDMPVRQAETAASRPSRGVGRFDSPDDWWESPSQDGAGSETIEPVEPAQPIHANLIEFPRELVATRKARPRLVEGPLAEAGRAGTQLSIFEVDPGAISTQPAAADAVAEPPESEWTGPEWSGIELDAQPEQEQELPSEPVPEAPALQLAPLGLRMMAAVVDGSLIVGAFLVAAQVAAANVKELPGLKAVELGLAVALFVIGALYQTIFLTLAEATPGMKYARISLCTFDDEKPTREQMRSRLGALLLSLVPLGLGVAWAIFDDEHLSWHDRLSRTYLRKC